MRSAVILLALVGAVLGESVRVQNEVGVAPKSPSILGYLKDVAIPAGEARKKAEEQYLNSQTRIVGGSPAGLGQFPWQAGLVSDIIGSNGNGVCGASLLTSNRLLTAAHCWYDGINQAWRFTVVLGSVFLFGSDGVRQQTSVVAVHPSWFPLYVRNDVAMIYLTNPVSFSNIISPISLPSGAELQQDFARHQAVASGFGLTVTGGSITSNQFLSHVTLNVITNLQCLLRFPFHVTSNNVCTSGAGGQGTCQGDSGGPLAVISNNRPVLIGVTSFGSPDGCDAGDPAAYARVTTFMDFINEHL